MKLRHLLFFVLASILFPVGCGAARYAVQVNGFLDASAPASLSPGAAIAVMENQEAQNPLLEKEIAAKIKLLLMARGYRVVPSGQADYHLFFLYGLGSPETATTTSPAVSVGLGIGVGSGHGAGGFIGLGAPYPYYPYPYPSEPYYGRWLTLKVVEAKPYRQSGQARAVWVGESRSAGTSSDLREVVNALLLAVFQQFGKNTGQAVKVEVRTEDRQYRELQAVR